jgi:hypothetical protein
MGGNVECESYITIYMLGESLTLILKKGCRKEHELYE